MRPGVLIALVAVAASFAGAADVPRFEVATFKQAPPPGTDSYPITLGAVSGSRLTFTNVTLSDCLKFAYGLVSDDQISGPDWINSRAILYDIVAVIAPDAPREQLQLMMQSLLADRLKLKMHHENKEMRYLALVPGKDSPKMPAAHVDPEHPRNNSAGRGRFTGTAASMALVTSMLSRMERQIIVDRTGLRGEFQVTLRWAPGSAGADVVLDDAAATGPSLFVAVQEQLGLKLESRKGPLDVIVIDSAERIPAEN